MNAIERLEALHATYMQRFLHCTDEASDPREVLAHTSAAVCALPALLRVAKAAQRLADNGDLDPGFSPDACLLLALAALEEVR